MAKTYFLTLEEFKQALIGALKPKKKKQTKKKKKK